MKKLISVLVVFTTIKCQSQLVVDSSFTCPKIKIEKVSCYKAKKSKNGKIELGSLQDPLNLVLGYKVSTSVPSVSNLYNKEGKLIESRNYDSVNNLLNISQYIQYRDNGISKFRLYRSTPAFDEFYQSFSVFQIQVINDSVLITTDSSFNIFGEFTGLSKTKQVHTSGKKRANGMNRMKVYHYESNGIDIGSFSIEEYHKINESPVVIYFDKDSNVTSRTYQSWQYDSLTKTKKYLRYFLSAKNDTTSKYVASYNTNGNEIHTRHVHFENNSIREFYFSYEYDYCNNWISKHVMNSKKELIFIIKRELTYWNE